MEVQKEKLISTERVLEEERKEREALEERFHQLEEHLRAEREKKEKQIHIRRFVKNWVVLPILIIGVLGGFISLFISKFTSWEFWWSCIGLWSLLLIIWVWLTDRHGLKGSIIKDWGPFIFFHKFKNWLFYLLGAVLLGVIGNAAWEWVKQARF